MAAHPRRGRHRPPPAAAWVAASVLWLLSLSALPSGSAAVRPSAHGLALQKNATGAPPAMAAFFRPGSGGAALPQAGNATAAVWDAPARTSPGDGDAGADDDVVDGRDRARTVLLTAGVVCAAVGVALLAAAALAYLVHARRGRRDGCGSGG